MVHARTTVWTRRSRARRGRGLRLGAVLLAAPLAGCMSYSRGDLDVDRTPIINTGTRASIIYPGQTAPALPGTSTQRQWTPPGGGQAGTQQGATTAPSTGGGAPTAPQAGTASPSGPGPEYAQQPSSDPNAGITFIGGSRMDEQRHVHVEEDPVALKWLTAPVAIAAAPFVLAKEALQGEPEPGPAVPLPRAPAVNPGPPATATRPPPPSRGMDYEAAMLQKLERELEQRQAQQPRVGTSPAPVSTSAPGTGPSIADELAALQRTPEPLRPEPPQAVAEPVERDTAAQSSVQPAHETAHGIVDRNGDGRIDHWIYREGGEITKEVFDQDFDGRPDRTVHFDLATHQISLVEEDTSEDGAIDSWVEYRDGAIVRRRGDANGDGRVDTWSFYRDGKLSRHEQDTSQDGFRDSVTFYENGRLVREQRDEDGDGQPEVTLYYDGAEKLARKEHDEDRDGRVDVISHYEQGRLVRRELLHAAGLAQQPDEGTEQN